MPRKSSNTNSVETEPVETQRERKPRTIPNNVVIFSDYEDGNNATIVITFRKQVVGVYMLLIDRGEFFSLGTSDTHHKTYYRMVHARQSPYKPVMTIEMGESTLAYKLTESTVTNIMGLTMPAILVMTNTPYVPEPEPEFPNETA